MTGFVFPGQGSQEVGMLRDFLEREATVRNCFAEAEDAIGVPLRTIALDGPEETLGRTETTQPVLADRERRAVASWNERGGATPSAMAGHSLGEYSLARRRRHRICGCRPPGADARPVMQEAVPAGAGAMAAILGLDEPEVAQCCADAGGVVSAANINAPGPIVIAGTVAAVDAAIERCSAAGAKRAIKLAVSVPSHCALMTGAAAKFANVLEQTPVTAPRVPVVQNVDASHTNDPARIRANLVAQLSKPVRWTQCVEAMVAAGATTLVECGPGKVSVD